MGNTLADYLDQGGGVVPQTFGFYSGSTLGLQGRITNSYLPFTGGSQANPGTETLVADVPAHPLLNGVNTFNGGSSSFMNSPITMANGATLVGHWSNGQPLIGALNDGAGRVAGLNFFPPSNDVRSDFWVSTTDGARLMLNALLWSGKIPPVIQVGPAGQSLPPGATAQFQVTAAGLPPLSYQWQLNGTNVPTATNRTLAVMVQPATQGTYDVIVSNLNGTTTSLGVSLNPPLNFLPPFLSGNSFSLYLVNADGSAMATNRAARVNIYSTPDLTWPLAAWQVLTNPVYPYNNELRADGFDTTHGAQQFFKAVETP